MVKTKFMKAMEIETQIENLKNHKGLLSINLKNGRHYPGVFHTDHLKGPLSKMESNNKWIFIVRPGFGLGWEEQINGDQIIDIKTNF
jgi:hypothetical protein